MVELGIFAAAVLGFGLVSRRVEASIVTAPMAFVAAGICANAIGLVDFGFGRGDRPLEFDLGNEVVLTLAEVALVLVLFTDAARMDVAALRGSAILPLRLLGVGMPLTIVAGTAAAVLLLDGLAFWEAAVIAAVLAPTDAALGHAVVSNRLVPARIRQALNVESGLNDGLSVPLLTIFIALAGAQEAFEPAGFWIRFAFEQIGFGLALGLGVGFIGGRLVNGAVLRGWMTGIFEQLSIAALAIIAWAAAEQVGGNGFIAAFIGGLAAGFAIKDVGKRVVDFTEDEGQLLNLAVFFIFGVLTLELLPDLTWEIGLYAVLSLTLIRALPVAISLIGARLRAVSVLFLGWFGPRGLASIILALVVLEEEADIAGRDVITLVMTSTVLLSVFAHGITAGPVSARYARRVGTMPEDAAEMREVIEMPTRMG